MTRSSSNALIPGLSYYPVSKTVRKNATGKKARKTAKRGRNVNRAALRHVHIKTRYDNHIKKCGRGIEVSDLINNIDKALKDSENRLKVKQDKMIAYARKRIHKAKACANMARHRYIKSLNVINKHGARKIKSYHYDQTGSQYYLNDKGETFLN